MSKAKQTLVEAYLERVSRGAVPMGGFYWVDPKELRHHSETVTARSVTDRDVTPPQALAHGLHAASSGERS